MLSAQVFSTNKLNFSPSELSSVSSGGHRYLFALLKTLEYDMRNRSETLGFSFESTNMYSTNIHFSFLDPEFHISSTFGNLGSCTGFTYSQVIMIYSMWPKMSDMFSNCG